MKNPPRYLALLLICLTLSACEEDVPVAYDASSPQLDAGQAAEWQRADCAREHQVVTSYRNQSGRETFRVTDTFFFEDLPGDPTDSLVRTCTVYPDIEPGCVPNAATNNDCQGDAEGPWSLCTVAFADTDAAGLPLASCGYSRTKETFNDDGSVFRTDEEPNAIEVYVRPN